jgi:hypothetical protein
MEGRSSLENGKSLDDPAVILVFSTPCPASGILLSGQSFQHQSESL